MQDPLAELVKIDPQSIGVGLYQHDVNQKQLAESLAGVVESVVNQVGVDVNTASPALLTHVAGIGPKLAEQIVAHRDQNGPFPSRAALQEVKGLGAKAFEQAAGFLRVRDGHNPLDASAIHPESYAAATALLQARPAHARPPRRSSAKPPSPASSPPPNSPPNWAPACPPWPTSSSSSSAPAATRAPMPRPLLRSDVLSMEDLQPGMLLNGTVRNVVDFGAFVDIGVKQDGLLHRSQIPRDTSLTVGDIIEVEINSVDSDRGRISLGWAENGP